MPISIFELCHGGVNFPLTRDWYSNFSNVALGLLEGYMKHCGEKKRTLKSCGKIHITQHGDNVGCWREINFCVGEAEKMSLLSEVAVQREKSLWFPCGFNQFGNSPTNSFAFSDTPTSVFTVSRDTAFYA